MRAVVLLFLSAMGATAPEALAVTLTIVVISAGVAAAAVKPRDAAATYAYLEAKLAEQHALAHEARAGLAAIEALASRVKSECPGVLAGAPLRAKPLSGSASEISRELLGGVLGIPEHNAHPLIARFDHAVLRLRWTNPRLTRLIHESAREEDEQSGLATPNLCADFKAWVASGYAATSPATKRYLHELDRISAITLIESEPHEEFTFDVDRVIAHRLKPYENRAARLLARELPQHVELWQLKPGSPQWQRLRALFEAAGKVYVALEAPPGATGVYGAPSTLQFTISNG